MQTLRESYLSLESIKVDDDIYPRQNKSQVTIDSYVEAIKGGASFPPIIVQEVEEDGTIKIISLDGLHRQEAYKKYNKLEDIQPIETIEVTFWKNEVLNKQEHLEELRIVALQLNLKHGLRVSERDIQYQAQRIVDARPIENLSGIGQELAELFGLAPSTMSDLIGARVRARRASRDSFILKLSLEGRTQTEISKVVGIERSVISKIVQNFGIEELHSLFNKGAEPQKIAELHQLDMPTLWAILLDGKTDEERFELFGKSEYSNDKPKIYDVWNFMKKDPRFSNNYPGFCFGQVLMNTLYRWSPPNGLVVDPMAGGGSTIDACLIMGRQCRAYDIKPSRKDIVKNDLRQGYPAEAENADLVFLDPPYYKKKEDDYNCPEIYETRDNHLEFIEQLAIDTYSTVKENGYVALLYSNYYDYEKEEDNIVTPELYCLFKNAGFSGRYSIQTPLNGSVQHDAHDVTWAREEKIILEISRDLYIFKKVS